MSSFLDRVRETFTTTGTGTLSLGGAATGFRTFVAALGGGGTVFYFAIGAPGGADADNWEFGYGTLTDASPDTLTRNVLASSSGSAISWASGTKHIMSAPIASVMNGLLSSFRSASAPAYPRAGMIWEDISGGATATLIKIYDGTDWITLMAVNETANLTHFTTRQRWAKGSDIASPGGGALALGTDGNYFDITGTNAITSIDTAGIGTVVKLHFDAALTLTHHATDLILPGAANITTAAGDEAEFVEYASGDWRCTVYTKASGRAVVGTAPDYIHLQDQKADGTVPDDLTIDAWTKATVNTEVTDSGSHCSIASSVITLAAGTYELDALHWVKHNSGSMRLRFQNTSDATTAVGPGMNISLGAPATTNTIMNASLRGRFTIAATKNFELQYFSEQAGTAGDDDRETAGVEVYCDIVLRKVA